MSYQRAEKFSGILVYFAREMRYKTRSGFELMNVSLRVECEKDSTLINGGSKNQINTG